MNTDPQFLDFLSPLGTWIIDVISTITTLAYLHAGLSVLAVLITIWVMQVTTTNATMATRFGRILWGKRIAFITLALALTLNILTPFIIPDPPWLSDIPVVIGTSFVLLFHGIESRLRS